MSGLQSRSAASGLNAQLADDPGRTFWMAFGASSTFAVGLKSSGICGLSRKQIVRYWT